MVKKTFDLISGAFVLRFTTNEDDWCQVVLCHKERSVELGAEVDYVVYPRLFSGLKQEVPEEDGGDIEGFRVWCVLALAERHTCFYLGERAAERVLFLQADDLSIIARIPLPPTIREQWHAQLVEACSDFSEEKRASATGRGINWSCIS